MKKESKLLLSFFVLSSISAVCFYIGMGKGISTTGTILQGVFLISVIAAPVVFICFIAEKMGKRMPEKTGRRVLISKPFQWIIGVFLLFIFFWLFIALMH